MKKISKLILFSFLVVSAFWGGYFGFYLLDKDSDSLAEQLPVPLSVDGVNITKEMYDSDQLLVFVDIGDIDINSLIRSGLTGPSEIISQAFSRNEKDNIVVIYLSNDQKEKVGAFLYSRERYNGIEKDIGHDFFKEHVKEKGSDVLNNSTQYWFAEEYFNNIEPELSKKLERENFVKEIEQ